MTIQYQLMCEKSGTDLKRILAAGRCDLTTNGNWSADTMVIIYPTAGEAVPWDLREWVVYWNAASGQYEQGEAIVSLSPELGDFVNANAVVTDIPTGMVGPFALMQNMVNRRELYNDDESPLHVPGFTPLVGPTGSVTNLNTIHGELGWHNQQVREARYTRPDNLLIYYGWLNSFNSAQHGWNNEGVAQELARYGLLVVGAGLEEPTHGDYANTVAIIARVAALNPECKIFGYVPTTDLLATFEDKVGKWHDLGVWGIFMDMAGYDYGTVATNGREAVNAKVAYVHGMEMACMVNAWNMDHIIGVANDPAYPNSTWNAGEDPSELEHDDWYLLESCPVNTTAYAASAGYEAKGDWAARCVKSQLHRATYGLKIAASGIIDDAASAGQELFDFGYVAATMFSLEAWGASDTGYGAGTARSKWWTRPDVSGLGLLSWLNPSVQVDGGDTDVFLRYTQYGRLRLDFSDNAQESTVEVW